MLSQVLICVDFFPQECPLRWKHGTSKISMSKFQASSKGMRWPVFSANTNPCQRHTTDSTAKSPASSHLTEYMQMICALLLLLLMPVFTGWSLRYFVDSTAPFTSFLDHCAGWNHWRSSTLSAGGSRMQCASHISSRWHQPFRASPIRFSSDPDSTWLEENRDQPWCFNCNVWTRSHRCADFKTMPSPTSAPLNRPIGVPVRLSGCQVVGCF